MGFSKLYYAILFFSFVAMGTVLISSFLNLSPNNSISGPPLVGSAGDRDCHTCQCLGTCPTTTTTTTTTTSATTTSSSSTSTSTTSGSTTTTTSETSTTTPTSSSTTTTTTTSAPSTGSFNASNFNCSPKVGANVCSLTYTNNFGENVLIAFIISDKSGNTVTSISYGAIPGNATAVAKYYCNNVGNYSVSYEAFRFSDSYLSKPVGYSDPSEMQSINC